MSRKRVSPEAQIIALFTGLSEEGKRMVMFGLNAIMSNEAPKSSAPVAAPRSPRRSGSKTANESSTASSETLKGDAGNAVQESLKSGSASKDKEPRCVAKVPGLGVECGETADKLIHDPTGGYGGYHEFEAIKSKKAAK